MTTGRDIARGLRRAYALMHRQTQSLLSQYDMTADQYVLLALLSLGDGITQKELTLRARSDPSTIRAMLVLMEDKGLVVREPHETDGRAHRILVTTKGQRIYTKLVTVLRPLQDALRSRFNEQEAEQLVDYLERVGDVMWQWELSRKSSKKAQ
jgi:DNA-binding MarR family transcriptional regulator